MLPWISSPGIFNHSHLDLWLKHLTCWPGKHPVVIEFSNDQQEGFVNLWLTCNFNESESVNGLTSFYKPETHHQSVFELKNHLDGRRNIFTKQEKKSSWILLCWLGFNHFSMCAEGIRHWIIPINTVTALKQHVNGSNLLWEYFFWKG